MKLLELFSKFTADEVLEKLFELFPDQKRSAVGYKIAWEEIQKTKPSFRKKDKYLIVIEERKDSYDGHTYQDVAGERIGANENFTWALELSPFADWLSWDVKDSSIERLGELNCLAHILWEMTWMGYSSKEVAEQKKKLDDSYKEAKKQYGKEKKKSKKYKTKNND